MKFRSTYLVVILILVVLMITSYLFNSRGDTSDDLSTPPPKIPHLRNEMTTPKFQEFKRTVARQAATFPDSYFLEALDYDQEVALTFDDGPDQIYTPQILDILKEYNVKATFFLLGSKMLQYPEVVQRIKAEGHAIGGHSYSHPDLRKISPEIAYATEIEKTQGIMLDLLGYQPLFFRPPYGAITDQQIDYLAQRNFKIVNWSIDTFDWDAKQNSVQEMTGKIKRYLHEGAIILMHSAGRDRKNTVKALPEIIKFLEASGYQLVTVPEMFK